MIRETGLTDALIVDRDDCWSVGDTFLHLLHDVQAFYFDLRGIDIALIVAYWENSQVHSVLDSFSMKDATGPVSNDLIIETEVQVAICRARM